MKGAASSVEDVSFRPACPPVGFMLIVMRDPFEDTPIAICSGQVDLNGPSGVIDGADYRAEAMLPFPIALRLIPASKPIQHIHSVTLTGKSPGVKERQLPTTFPVAAGDRRWIKAARRRLPQLQTFPIYVLFDRDGRQRSTGFRTVTMR